MRVRSWLLCFVVAYALFGGASAIAQTCTGHVKTQAQLLTEWQTCAAQGLGPGCLDASHVQDIICSTPSVTGTNAWSGQNSIPEIPLTDGATITPAANGSTQYFLTLTGNNHKMNCPTSPVNVQWLTFEIKQGTGGPAGGFQLTWDDTCYGFANFQPPVLTGDTGAVDSISCFSVGRTPQFQCGALVPSIGSGFLVRNNHTTSSCSSSSACSITLPNNQQGDLRIIGIGWGGGATNPVAADVVGINDEHGNSSCTQLSGTFKAIPAATRAVAIWACPVSIGGTTSTATVSFSSSQGFITLFGVEVLGAATVYDAGLGNGANGTSTSLSVAATGPVTQTNSFVFAMMRSEGGLANSFTAGQTQLDNTGGTNPQLDEYSIVNSGTPTMTATQGGTAQAWAAAVAVFKHK